MQVVSQMKFQRGRKVKVKSKEQLLKWLEENGFIKKTCGDFRHSDSFMTFKDEMFDNCDCILTVNGIFNWYEWDIYRFLETPWCFLGDWLTTPYSTFIEVDENEICQ